MKFVQPIIIESILPTIYNKITEKFKLNYGFHSTIFGNCLIGLLNDKIGYLSFGDNDALMFEALKKSWEGASFIEDNIETKIIIEKIFNFPSVEINQAFKVLVKGTNFQVRVWEILCTIPFGTTVSYESIAYNIGNPRAIRAAANSIGKNNISFLIPCHRVIKKSGQFHKYRWGEELKKTMIEWEKANSF